MSKQVRMEELENMTLKQLYELARKYKISYYSKLTKKELIVSIIKEEIILRVLVIFIFLLHKFDALICEMGIRCMERFVHQRIMNGIMDFYKLRQSMEKIQSLQRNGCIFRDLPHCTQIVK